jgi:hypothetical protein
VETYQAGENKIHFNLKTEKKVRGRIRRKWEGIIKLKLNKYVLGCGFNSLGARWDLVPT